VNLVLNFLSEHSDLLAPAGSHEPLKHSYLVNTPRFATSRNVIFLIYCADSSDPCLVAKIPRVADDGGFLAREAANLRAVHASRPDGFRSIPRLVAHETYRGTILLIETALLGRVMRPAVFRKHDAHCLQEVLRWISDLHGRTVQRGWAESDEFVRLVQTPLSCLEATLAADAETHGLIASTRDLVAPLRSADVPRVFEHADLSSPNILLMPDGTPGIVDWELSDPTGLPAIDLFFFLAFVAFARRQAQTPSEFVAAFRDAFFGPNCWSLPYVQQYAERIGLSRAILKPLFVLCWCRYLAHVANRMQTDHTETLSDPRNGSRLQEDRYWHLWKYTVEHVENIHF